MRPKFLCINNKAECKYQLLNLHSALFIHTQIMDLSNVTIIEKQKKQFLFQNIVACDVVFYCILLHFRFATCFS